LPWREGSTVGMRLEFVTLASAEGANKRELCRRFGISPQTGYKWLERYERKGRTGLPIALGVRTTRLDTARRTRRLLYLLSATSIRRGVGASWRRA